MPAISDDKKEYVIKLLREGRKIEAIKYVSSEFGLPLKQSKKFIDQLILEYPEIPLRPSRRVNYTKVGVMIGGIFGAIGIVLLGIAFIIYSNHQSLIDRSRLVIGEVIDLQSGESGFSPVINYEIEGVMHTYYSNVYTNPSAFEMGEQVEIYVDMTNPENILINTFSEKWLAITILAGVGGVFATIGLTAFLTSVISGKKKPASIG